MFGDLLRGDRERAGMSVEQAARRFGVSTAEYRSIEAGARYPDFNTKTRYVDGSAGGRPFRPFMAPSTFPVVDWPAAETFLAYLDAPARRTVLGILEGRRSFAPRRSGGSTPATRERHSRSF